MKENEITGRIIGAAYKIHCSLGPGLFESVYEALMFHELEKRGLKVIRQCPIPLVYESLKFKAGFRADLLVEDKVIVELKSVESLALVHRKQLLTYLRVADKRVGLLINFGAAFIKDGIIKVVNHLKE